MMEPGLIGKTLSHYKIIEKLGEGGMGVVYLAEDTKLGRRIALKLLPADWTRDSKARVRFMHEAQTAAALNHPSICTIHEVDEAGGQVFLAMEHIEGESLRERIERGPMKVADVVAAALEVGQGLAAAHARGIVHRDVKPGNVMLTSDGRAKVLDFGLALAPERTRLTMEGRTTGTVSYMSPEQSRGASVDHRTDIWSLGVMIYEMLTGQRPFEGEHEQAVLRAIMDDEPEPPTGLRTGVPLALERVVGKAMSKHPEERYQTVPDMLVDLKAIVRDLEAETMTRTAGRPQPFTAAPGRGRRWRGLAVGAVVSVAALAGLIWNANRTPPPGTEPARVVVAVFENMTGDESLDPIGPMVADWIGQGLSQTGAVEVVSAVTALQSSRAVGAEAGGLQGVEQLRELAERTRASTVVSGSYFLEGKDLRFHAKVTNAEDGSIVYAPAAVRGSREAPMETIETLRQRIMGALVTDFDPSLIAQPPIFEAYREYVLGLDLFDDGNPRAMYHFGRAAAIDSTFMSPRLFIVGAYANQGEWAKADSILRLLDRNREKLGRLEHLGIDFNITWSQGNHEESLRILREMAKLEPEVDLWSFLIGQRALWVNRPRETIDAYAPYAKQAPATEARAWTWGPTIAADARHMLEDYDGELEGLRRAIEHFPDVMDLRAREVRALAAAGRVRAVDDVIDGVLATPSGVGSPVCVIRAAALELRAHGHADEAIRVARRGIQRGEEADEQYHPYHLVELLSLTEQWTRVREVLDGLARVDPDKIMYQGMLGCLAARTGDHGEALRIREELEHLDRPYMLGDNFYWSACITALLGEQERAVGLLREAFASGYQYGPGLHRDPNLEPLRDYGPFQELLRPKG